MHAASDENRLKPCLSRIIDAISHCLQKLKDKNRLSAANSTEQLQTDESDSEFLSPNGHLSTNIDKFTLDQTEMDLLEQLTEDIEALLNDCFPYLTKVCSNAFADYLHQYHYDEEKQKFARPLTKNVLPSIRRELKGFLGMFKQDFYLKENKK